MLVARHKRSKDGPAILPILADMQEYMATYIDVIRPKFALKDEQKIFVTTEGHGFQWNKPKNHVPFTTQPEFPESLGKWKTPTYLSVGTRAVIGQFCGRAVLYSTAPLTLKISFSTRPINLGDIINILTNLVFSVHTVSYESLFFPVGLWPALSRLGHKRTGKKLGP